MEYDSYINVNVNIINTRSGKALLGLATRGLAWLGEDLIEVGNVKCENCKYEWDYTGTKTVYAVCPNCRRIVKIK